MKTTKQPYELLVRWGTSGQLTGAHIQYRYVTKEGEVLMGEFLGNAEPLALGEFPLADLLNQAQIDALSVTMQLRGNVTELEMKLSEQDQVISNITAEVKALRLELNQERKVQI